MSTINDTSNTEVIFDDDGNMVVVGKQAGTGASTSVEPKPKEVEDVPAKTAVTLRQLIEQGLADQMTARITGPGRRYRGKGRAGNGGHPSLINLHRDLGRTGALRWIDADAGKDQE